MLAKYWKRIGFIILIIACLFNIMSKLVGKNSLDKEMLFSAEYTAEQERNQTNNK